MCGRGPDYRSLAAPESRKRADAADFTVRSRTARLAPDPMVRVALGTPGQGVSARMRVRWRSTANAVTLALAGDGTLSATYLGP